MVYKYGWDDSTGKDPKAVAAAFERAMLANANRGGENVAPGALIGAVLGANAGYSRLPKSLVDGLCPVQRAELDDSINSFVATAPFATALVASTCTGATGAAQRL